MGTHQTRLLGRETVADRTMAFRFEKPAGFAFEPGQAIDVVLPEAASADAQDARHTFSIVAAPFEDELVVATRMRDSAFKRAIGSMPIGANLAIEGPTGSLTLHADRARAAVFIAGGIGITPFLSMLRQAAHDRLAQALVLLYSNRRPEDAAYLDELTTLEQRNGRFRCIATMTSISSSKQAWTGSIGPIDEALLQRALDGLTGPVCYVAGPPGLVEAMRLTLGDVGVNDADIRSEEFYGY